MSKPAPRAGSPPPPAPPDGLARLAGWVSARAKDFEVIAQMRDADSPAADRALELVRAFIIARGLVLYGGQAIDYALRLKGSGIYPEHQTPDFDFFSPRNVDDAFDLADILRDAGIPNVGAHPAIHPQTMRVKTNFIFVADISHIPAALFERLPTVSYRGMRILHPDFQRLDMHLAFCFPFSNPPREDVFHRFGKDLKRFNLFEQHYPITAGGALGRPVEGGGGANAADATDVADAAEIGPDAVEFDPARAAVHGVAGYGLLRAALDELCETFGADADVPDAPRVAVRAEPAPGGRMRLGFTPPPEAPRLVLATPWPAELIAAVGGREAEVQWYAPYLDARPLMAEVQGGSLPVSLYTTINRLLAVSVVRVGQVRVTVAGPQYLLLYFLCEAHAATTDERRDFFVRYYLATLAVLARADAVLAAAEGSGDPVLFRRMVAASPFGLTVRTLGEDNRDVSYLIRLVGSARAMGEPLPPSMRISPADVPDLAFVPPKYYPSPRGGETHPQFDYDANPAFQRAGQLIEPPPGLAMDDHDLPASAVGGGSSASSAKPGPPPTYLALFEELDGTELDAALQPRGWRRTTAASAARRGYADLVIVDGKFNWDSRLRSIKSGYKSRIDAPALTNKIELHKLLEGEGITRETVVVEADRKTAPTVPDDDIWIWRPEGGWSGKGVAVVDSQEALDRAWGTLSRGKRAILSRYIRDPALTRGGLKFHLRMYYLVVAGPGGERRAALYREGEIAHARAPYVDGAYDDPGVHDTHFDWSEEMLFPGDYPGDAEDVLAQCAGLLTRVGERALPLAKPYAESRVGFEILGCDFMVDAAGQVWLIEINTKPGYAMKQAVNDHVRWISRLIFSGVASFVLGLKTEVDVIIPLTPPVGATGAAAARSARTPTYFVDIGEVFDEAAFVAEADRRGWKNVGGLAQAQAAQPLDLVYVYGKRASYDRQYWDLRARIKCRVDAPGLTDKANLHLLLMAKAPDLIPETVVVPAGGRTPPALPGDGAWIWRPEKGWGGHGVAVVDDQSQLDALWRKHRREFPRQRGLLSRYIVDPMLFPHQGGLHKFHLRIWIILVASPAGNRLGIYRRGKIITAAKPYRAEDFSDRKIHDTHKEGSVVENFGFPEKFPGDAAATLDQMVAMFGRIGAIGLRGVKPYPESVEAFEMMGADVMFDTTGRPWLIEINNMPGFAGDDTAQIARIIFGGIWEFALEPKPADEREFVIQCYP